MENTDKYCKNCKTDTLHIAELLETGPHYGRYYCSVCQWSWGWIAKPRNNGKRKKNKHSPAAMDIDYCQMCLRERNNLINSETLESHHVQEISNHGSDIPENIWVVCTYCHKLIHTTRTYIRRADGNYKKNP